MRSLCLEAWLYGGVPLWLLGGRGIPLGLMGGRGSCRHRAGGLLEGSRRLWGVWGVLRVLLCARGSSGGCRPSTAEQARQVAVGY